MKPRGLFALTLFVFILLTGILLTAAPAQDQQFAKLGDVMLERGEILRDRRIGYRTYGKLNPAKSKAILFPT